MTILKHKLFTPIFLCLLLAIFLIYLVFSGASQDLYSEKLSDTNPIINYSKLNIQHKERTIRIKLDNGYEIEIAKSKLHNIISEIHNEKNNILKQFYEENQVQIERILSQAKPSITTELADWNYDINRLNTHIFYICNFLYY